MGTGQPSSQSQGAVGEERATRGAPSPAQVACAAPGQVPSCQGGPEAEEGFGKTEGKGVCPDPGKTDEFLLWASGMALIHSFIHSCLCWI